MNELPLIGYPCMRKELWDRKGANTSLEECMAKSCFYVQKKDFGERLTLFRRYFIANGLGVNMRRMKVFV